MKKNYLSDLSEIQEMAKKLRTVNESITFAESYNGEYDDMGMEDDDMNGEESMGAENDMTPSVEPDETGEGSSALSKIPTEEPDPEEGLRETGEVDQIREIALRGMIKLCKNPEDDRYQALKKIFQFCDKAAENKDNENAQK